MQRLTLFPGDVLDWSEGGSRRELAASAVPVQAVPGPSGQAVPGEAHGENDDLYYVARVRQGDEDAARILVHRLHPTVIKSVRCHRPKRTSEEDLVQAVFVKVFHKLHQFSGLVPLEHWVSRIAVNTCLNQLKHEHIRPELRMGDLTPEEEEVVQRLASTDEEASREPSGAARELLDKLLTQLKPDERLVITLLHLEERSTKEISQMTGWSVPLVKIKAFRARHKMRKLWQTLIQGRPWWKDLRPSLA